MTTASDGMTAVMARALSNSAKALSQFLGNRSLQPTEFALSHHRLAELPVLWGREDTPVAAVVLDVSGDLDGFLLLIVSLDECQRFLSPLIGDVTFDTDEQLAESALGELGNVVGSAFLNDLADQFSMNVKPSPPAVVRDMIGALLATLAAALAEEQRLELPVVRAQLAGNGRQTSAYLLWLPGRSDLERLEALS